MDITRGEIVKAITELNLKTVEEVGRATEAGTGCGGCQPVIQEILDEINK
jgi:NAD(P)H-nitrite reductase large subunit